MGDPAGIGPEVAVKAIHKLIHDKSVRFTWIGAPEIFYTLADKFKLRVPESSLSFALAGSLKKPIRYGFSRKDLTVLAVESIRLAVGLAMQKQIDAIVTAPINKAGLKAAGYKMPGHTEFLAELSGTKRFDMMLVGAKLRVVLVTRHEAIRDVASKITRQKVIDTILLADRELRRSFRIRRPRIVVCGLNPHAGESGTIGKEELRVIEPAVQSARKMTDARIYGPLSADALFHDAYQGRYDAEICMYHDQGLVPLKMISRGHGVNVTLGLPFVRTSPDHGTAYDIAGKFRADAGSMIEAIDLARMMAKNRKAARV